MNPAYTIVILAVVLAAGPATAGATASPPFSASEACRDTEPTRNVVVGTVPGANSIYEADATATLYPQTTLFVAYCTGGIAADPDGEWTVRNGSGLTAIERVEGERYYRVTLTDGVGRIDFENRVDVPVTDAFVVHVQGAPTVESKLSGRNLTFDTTNASDYRQAEETFRTELNRTETAAGQLDDTAALLETEGASAVDGETLDTANETLSTIQESRTELRERSARVERLLFARAATGLPGSGAAVETLAVAESRERRAREETTTAVRRYEAAVRGVAASALGSVLVQFLLGTAVGLAVGGAAGAVRPHARGKEVDDFRDHTSGMKYTWRLVLPVVALGAVLTVAGIGLAVWMGVPQTLLMGSPVPNAVGTLGGGGVLAVLLPVPIDAVDTGEVTR